MSDNFGVLRAATVGIDAAARRESISVPIEARSFFDAAKQKLHGSTRSARAGWVADVSLNGNGSRAGTIGEIVEMFEATAL